MLLQRTKSRLSSGTAASESGRTPSMAVMLERAFKLSARLTSASVA